MQSNLQLYLDILRQHGITPTFPITAKTLGRHPDIIQKLSAAGAEFAVHGYNHIDCTRLTSEQLSEQIQKAINIFRHNEVPFSGFRFPYLRWNRDGMNLIDSPLFKWDSSHCVLWGVLNNITTSDRNWQTYQTVLSQYTFKNSDAFISLPRFHNNMLEIPVSLPDDDLLFDRLGIQEERILTQIWSEILRNSYSRGELFTLQLHPERISFYKETLKTLLHTADTFEPKIWITSLSSIYDWWKEKQGFSTEIHKKPNGEYRINAHCSKRAILLIKTKEIEDGNFFNQYRLINRNPFTIRSSKRPVIGISKNSSPMLVRLLKNEGFIFEIGTDENNCSVFLNGLDVLNEEDEIKVLEKINNSQLPLVRFWRWPDACRSALSITGDIDALTSSDFLLRLVGR
ncbi:MAG: polysaccharide deacetylase family protein [Candidatus Hodarchaeota archaeon]